MNNISILIKPSSSNCNLGCKYCFYYDVAAHREHKSFGFMEEPRVTSLIEKAFMTGSQQVKFVFQGGEPTLIGLEYFRFFVNEVNRLKENQTVNYAIQTNGTLLNDDFCDFFHENRFLVGISLDGPKDVHDMNRLNSKGQGTFKEVNRAADLLVKYGVEFNIVAVVTKASVRHVRKIYQYFKNQDYRYLQFIPCINDFDESELKPYNITPQEYGEFLVELFEMWYSDIIIGNPISIRTFDNYVQMLLGMPPESCDMNGFCSVNPVVEADGSVYPCDFYVLDQWKLGNIKDDEFEVLMKSEVASSFVASGQHVDEKCHSCEYFHLCRGGCRRHKEMYQNLNGINNGELGINYFCESYLNFFDKCYVKLKNVASMIRSKQLPMGK
jgi:uncharacterized protein